MTDNKAMRQLRIKECFALARSLGYYGDEAHGFLLEKAGVESLLVLDVTRLASLARDIRALAASKDRPPSVSEPQWRAVWALRRRLRCNERQFKKLLKHITGLDHQNFLDVPSCRTLIAGLNKIADGQEARKAKPRRAKDSRH